MQTKYSRKATIKFLFLFGLLYSGCKEIQSNKNENEVISSRVDKNFRVLDGDKYLDFKLPDTIALKDTLKGYIVYKSDFDSIPKVPESTHFVNLYFTNTDRLSQDFSEFKTKKSDTFARIHDSLFIIYDINFKKRGNHLLEGYIKDCLYEDVGADSVRFRTIENHILYQVFVD